MDALERLLGGIAAGVQPEAIAVITLGVLIGLFVGAAPGLGPTVGMAVVLPFALTLGPEHAVFLLVSILVASDFSNAIPAILLRIPGTPSALLTAVEGNPFHERGEGGKALLIALIASTLAQLFAIVLFILFVVPISQVAVRLLFPELFAVTLFGLLAAVGMLGLSLRKGFVALLVGLLLSMVGPDPITAVPRFTYGISELGFGLPLIPVIVGLLAFSEVFLEASRHVSSVKAKVPNVTIQWLSKAEWKALAVPLLVGGVLGTVIGAVPAAGATVATFVTYQVMKSLPRGPQTSGKDPGMLAAVEGSNNAAAVGDLIPTFGLGIPGGAAMVVVMASLSAQGLIPGPSLLQTRPELLYAVFGGLLTATAVTALLGYALIRPAVLIARLGRPLVFTVTMALTVAGVFALRWSLFDVWTCLAAGLLGMVMILRGYPVAPVALAFVLGDILEANLRRGLIQTDGFVGFVSRPVTLALLLVASLMIIGPPLLRRWFASRTAPPLTAGE